MPRPVLPVLAFVAFVVAGCSDRAEEGPVHVEGTFLPVDDGVSDRGFAAIREQLQGVIARRDTSALLVFIGENARLSYGDDPGGPDGLRSMWLSGDPPGGEPVWDVLRRILDAGSVEVDGAITVPYVFAIWPDSIDAFSHVAVVGDSIAATVAPSDTSGVVALVSHAILPAPEPAASGYRRVRLPDGAEAYIPASAAMSPIGYRAVFWKEGSVWKLQTLLAGD